MHASIGSTSALDFEIRRDEVAKDALYLALNRAEIVLTRPAVEMQSVVCDAQAQTNQPATGFGDGL